MEQQKAAASPAPAPCRQQPLALALQNMRPSGHKTADIGAYLHRRPLTPQ